MSCRAGSSRVLRAVYRAVACRPVSFSISCRPFVVSWHPFIPVLCRLLTPCRVTGLPVSCHAVSFLPLPYRLLSCHAVCCRRDVSCRVFPCPAVCCRAVWFAAVTLSFRAVWFPGPNPKPFPSKPKTGPHKPDQAPNNPPNPQI